MAATDKAKNKRLQTADKGDDSAAHKAGAQFYARMAAQWNTGADLTGDGEPDTPPVKTLWSVWTFAAAAAGVAAGLWWYFSQRG